MPLTHAPRRRLSPLRSPVNRCRGGMLIFVRDPHRQGDGTRRRSSIRSITCRFVALHTSFTTMLVLTPDGHVFQNATARTTPRSRRPSISTRTNPDLRLEHGRRGARQGGDGVAQAAQPPRVPWRGRRRLDRCVPPSRFRYVLAIDACSRADGCLKAHAGHALRVAALWGYGSAGSGGPLGMVETVCCRFSVPRAVLVSQRATGTSCRSSAQVAQHPTPPARVAPALLVIDRCGPTDAVVLVCIG